MSLFEATEEERRRADVEQRALKLLTRREHSRLELSLKLQQRRFDESDIEPVLDQLVAQGWLDDERFADIYARQRMELGYGPMRIRAELQQKGVRDEPEALTSVSESTWREAAIEQRARRFGLTRVANRKERGRQGRFLAQRGYTMAQIEAALAQSESERD